MNEVCGAVITTITPNESATGKPRDLHLLLRCFGMRSNSDWQNRLGTIRVAALGVMVVIIGVIWYVRH